VLIKKFPKITHVKDTEIYEPDYLTVNVIDSDNNNNSKSTAESKQK